MCLPLVLRLQRSERSNLWENIVSLCFAESVSNTKHSTQPTLQHDHAVKSMRINTPCSPILKTIQGRKYLLQLIQLFL